MLKIKYEQISPVNDNFNKHLERSFVSLETLENWIFDQMSQDYTGNSRAISFPNPKSPNGPSCISFTPTYGGERYLIHQIENGIGIMFSDGTHTAGQKHWSKDVQTWLTHCEERRQNPTFNFVD